MESGKNRSSSILKPQKARNPLSDLDFTEAVEDISMVTTGRLPMRRVSFASSNFVKEFATDPEKNTIWDSTYEETVNSDSTQSSENAHNTLRMQNTQCSDSAQITNENIHCVTMSNNVTGAFSSDKENQMCNNFHAMTPKFSEVKISNLSTGVDSLNKENINILSNDTRFISSKRDFQIANNNMKIMPSVSLATESSFRNSKNITVTDDTSMEFTPHITRSNNSSSKVCGNRTVMSDISMEVTRLLVSRLATNEVVENRTITNEDDMEFTQQITDINTEDLENVQNTLAETADNMEFTRQHISSLNKTIRDETIMSEENMEYTRAVGIINKADCTQNKTVTSDDEVEVNENETSLKISSGEDGQITNSTSVEQALTGLRSLDAQVVSTRANTVPHSICEFKTPGSSFHTSFIDDTQHLINYSLSNRRPKSDFSKIITGDLNPTPLSSKCMDLSDFSSCAFPISLDNTRNNQTHLDYTQTDKDNSCKDYYDDKPQQIICSVDSKPVALHGDTLSILQETNCSNQTDLNDIEVTDDNRRHQVTYLLNDKDNSSVKVEEIVKTQKRRSSKNIEAAVACKKMVVDTIENLNLVSVALEMETSINDQIKMDQNSQCSRGETLNISQENLTLSDSIDDSVLSISVATQQVIGNITKSFNSTSIDSTGLASKITENRLSSRSKTLWDNENDNSIRSTIDEFLVKTRSQLATMNKNSALFEEKCGEAMMKLRAPFKQLSFVEEAQGSIGSIMEYSSNEPTISDMVQEENLLLEVNTKIERVLTLDEEIEKKCRRSKRYCTMFAKEENKYQFYTLYNSIRLVVYFNMEVGIVNATEVYSRISDESDAVALFVHKICKERLSQEHIKSAVGDRFDILTLLDYVYMNAQKMLDILNEFDSYKKSYAMKMDENFRMTLTIVNTYLANTWCISVDMADIDNITEDSVSAWAKVGTVKEAEIKNLVKSCPSGVLFLQSFMKNVHEYVNLLNKRKEILKMKMENVG